MFTIDSIIPMLTYFLKDGIISENGWLVWQQIPLILMEETYEETQITIFGDQYVNGIDSPASGSSHNIHRGGL